MVGRRPNRRQARSGAGCAVLQERTDKGRVGTIRKRDDKKISRDHIRRLMSGRFLEFATAVTNRHFVSMIEWRFRNYWKQATGINERQRFSQVPLRIN
jgi:hypothetical protein